MKPSTRATIDLLRRFPKQWVNHADLAVIGGHRYGGRIHELRGMGYVIEQRGPAQASQYRLMDEPTGSREWICPCGWHGVWPTYDPRHECPVCGHQFGQQVLAL